MESKKDNKKAEIDKKRKAKEGTCLPGKKKVVVGLMPSKINKKAKYLEH